jgi:hypothetical protein
MNPKPCVEFKCPKCTVTVLRFYRRDGLLLFDSRHTSVKVIPGLADQVVVTGEVTRQWMRGQCVSDDLRDSADFRLDLSCKCGVTVRHLRELAARARDSWPKGNLVVRMEV